MLDLAWRKKTMNNRLTSNTRDERGEQERMKEDEGVSPQRIHGDSTADPWSQTSYHQLKQSMAGPAALVEIWNGKRIKKINKVCFIVDRSWAQASQSPHFTNSFVCVYVLF